MWAPRVSAQRRQHSLDIRDVGRVRDDLQTLVTTRGAGSPRHGAAELGGGESQGNLATRLTLPKEPRFAALVPRRLLPPLLCVCFLRWVVRSGLSLRWSGCALPRMEGMRYRKAHGVE